MADKPLVSVLMTAYNREKYIAEAIESVIFSTYENWELIIVDDQSIDRTIEIAKSYEPKDKRIRVYMNETNLGDYPNRNKAASYAKGKYLKYLDADDLLFPHGLEVMVRAMETFPGAGLAIAMAMSETQIYPYKLKPEDAYKEHFYESALFIRAPTSTIISREAFYAVGTFSGRRMIGDEELWFKLAAKFPIIKMVLGTAYWRSHGEQESNDAYKFILESYLLKMELLNSSDCPLKQEDVEKVIKQLKHKFARHVVLSQAIKEFKIKRAFKIYKKSKLTIIDILKALKKRK